MSMTELKTETAPTPDAAPNGLTADVLTKYKTAGSIVARALNGVISKTVEGANVLSLCQEGDKLVEDLLSNVYKGGKIPKGLAFPCTVSVNNVVCHFTPLASDPTASQTLNQHDVVKLVLGAHIDGYPAVSGETVIVGATATSPISGPRADLLAATWYATEAALRSVKPGGKNWDVTDCVKKVLGDYQGSIKGLEGMVSHQHQQNELTGKKTINLFPSADQHRDKDSTFTFEEGEVYGLDVVLTNGQEAKAKLLGDRTTLFQRTNSTYQLKMKTSRATYGEIAKKGAFPFTLRSLEDEQKARMGVKECVQHGMLKEFEQTTTADTRDVVAQFFTTFYVTSTGVQRVSLAPTFYTGPGSDKVQSEVKIRDTELLALLARGLNPKKKKAAK